MRFDNILPNDSIVHITYENLKILLGKYLFCRKLFSGIYIVRLSETVESEMKKLEEAALQIDRSSNSSVMPPLQPLKVIQSVKCIINLMGDLCTLDIMQTVEALMEFCKNFIPSNVSLKLSPNKRFYVFVNS